MIHDLIEILTVLTIITPIIGWLVIYVFRNLGLELSKTAIITASLTFIISVLNTSLYFSILNGEVIHITLITFLKLKLISFVVDRTSMLISFLVVFIGLITLIFSYGYMTPKNKEYAIVKGYSWFYGLMLLFMGSMVGVVLSYSLITLLIFYELTGICSWALIAFFHEEPKSRYASLKALYITHLGWLLLIITTAITYSETGRLTLDALMSLNPNTKFLVLLLTSIACWSKSAQGPFYLWLPDAMIAPTPVSAYLHAAAMVKVGPYVLFRFIQYSRPSNPLLAYIVSSVAVITMIYGLLMYVPQVDMKRLLAYSTIVQISYMFLALSFACVGIDMGLKASIYHLWNHAYAKALFFLTAGALSYATGSRLLTSYRGIIAKNKILALSFAIALFSIAGIPPLNCFFSKLLTFLAGFRVGSLWAYIVTLIAIGESACGFIVFLYWLTRTVYGIPSNEVIKAQDIPNSITASLIVLIIMCLTSAILAYPIISSIGYVGGSYG